MLNLPQTCAEKFEFWNSKKGNKQFEISLKLCALLALESYAKGAQNHN